MNVKDSRALYARLLRYLRPYWHVFSLAVFAMIAAAATQASIPIIVKPILDEGFIERDPASITGLTALLVFVFVLRGFAGWGRAVAFEAVSGRILVDLRALMFDKLLALPIGVPGRASTPQLMSKLTFNTTQMIQAATKSLTALVTDSLTVLGLLTWMAWLDWQLTLMMLLAAPVIGITLRYFNRRLRRMSRLVQDHMGQVNDRLRETLDGEKTVRVFGGQEYERRRFADALNAVRRNSFKFAIAAAYPSSIIQIVIALSVAAVIGIYASRGASSGVTVGSFVSFITAAMLLFPSIRVLTAVNASIQRALAAAQSVFELIDETAEPDTGTRELGQTRGRLEFDAVGFRYSEERPPALRDISLVIESGETLALVGPSGAGKSTLANLIPRFFDPSAGVIRLDGVDIREYTLASLRKQIAIVSQEIVLFNDTVARNIAYGALASAARLAILDAAEAAYVTDFLDDLSRGLDTPLGEHGFDLSGGQRQRIAIARAFLKNAPILVLDEATSALDSASELRIQTALASLRKGRTTIVIAHRPSTIDMADRIAVMQESRLVAVGRHDELLGAVPLYRNLRSLHDHAARADARIRV